MVETPFATAPLSGSRDVDAACQAAAAAFPAWRDRPASERSPALLRIADALAARGEELIRLEGENTGRPFGLTMVEALPPTVDQIRSFAGAALRGAVVLRPGGRGGGGEGAPGVEGRPSLPLRIGERPPAGGDVVRAKDRLESLNRSRRAGMTQTGLGSPYTSPSLTARTAAAAREETPSFEWMFET